MITGVSTIYTYIFGNLSAMEGNVSDFFTVYPSFEYFLENTCNISEKTSFWGEPKVYSKFS